MLPADLPPPAHHVSCLAPAWREARPAFSDTLTSTSYPIAVHYQRTSDLARAQRVLSAAETAWRVQVDELGWRAPVLPDAADGPELDLYLSQVGAGSAWTAPDANTDAVHGDGHMSVPAYIAIDRNLPLSDVDLYVAHEFNHVLQFATDFSEGTLTIWEATANSAQSWTFGAPGHWDDSVYDFQVAPWAPVLVGDGSGVSQYIDGGWLYEYGAALWVWRIDQLHGGDAAGAIALWEAASNEGWDLEPDAVDAFAAMYDGDLGAGLNDVAMVRWLTGSRWDDRGLAEARTWTSDNAVPTALTIDAIPFTGDFGDMAPMITGQAFAELDLSAAHGDVRVDVGSASGLHTAVIALTWTADGTASSVEASGVAPSLTLSADVTRAVIAVSNLGHASWDGEDEAWVDGDQTLSIYDVGTGPGDTGDTGDEPGGGCGCDGGGTGGAGLLALLGVLALRRRR